MTDYLITYDLNIPGQDYSKLFDAIIKLGSAYHGMQNTWFVKSNYSATEIRNFLKSFIDSNDKLFVCQISVWASSNMNDVAKWLNEI